MTLTAKADGWEAVRLAVMTRDRHSCVAVRADLWKGVEVELDRGMCRNSYGPARPVLRLDHVDPFMTYLRKALDSEAFLQSVCDYHHETWATRAESRHSSRERLSALYPEEWAEWIAR